MCDLYMGGSIEEEDGKPVGVEDRIDETLTRARQRSSSLLSGVLKQSGEDSVWLKALQEESESW